MKTITVTDETYVFLMGLAEEVNTQDNISTAKPYYFAIQEDEEAYVPDGYGDEIWVDRNGDGLKLRTEEDIKEAIFELKGWIIDNKLNEKEYNKMGQYARESILEEHYRKVSVVIEHKYSNVFLTEKAYKQHLIENRHNLNNPQSYIFHAFRNNEMSMLFKFIEELSDNKKSPETWREDLSIYLSLARQAKEDLLSDKKFMDKWMEFNQKCNYELTVKKAHDMFWGTEEGWKYCKRKRKSKTINILSALKNSLDRNRVYNYQVEKNKEFKSFNKDQYVSERLAVIEKKMEKESDAKKWQ